ncbi:hypothetical protein F4678DRAFT_95374 [Xylaria arbuscula]|nr:hypothetical protein F4678DRAFT_95374 [Xylaria arbuscula]
MKLINILLMASSVAAAAISTDINLRDADAVVPRHHKGVTASTNNNQNANSRKKGGKNGGNQGGNAAAAGSATTTSGSANSTTTGDTLVLKEVGGVAGNECLTFRNNGEIVDAACVDESADRQITPSTINGASGLTVQRSFTAGFRADLVGIQACVGFNGTDFLASDCSDSSTEPVSFTGGELRTASGACASGHDDLAQMTVDTTGQSCAQYKSTAVTPTAP